MKVKMSGLVFMTLEMKPNGKPSLRECEAELHLSDKLDESAYRHEDGSLNRTGLQALTQCFIQGINANIQSAHQTGDWDSAEHLRWVIAQLEKSFIQPAQVIHPKIEP
jgi:hypothetical protein